MIAPGLVALLVAPVLAAPVYSAAFGARAELRMRAPGDAKVDGTSSDQSFDADFSGSARLITRFRRVELEIGYLPRLTFRDFAGAPSRDVLHGGEAAATWRARRVTLSLRETVYYGDRYFSPLAGFGDAGRPPQAPSQAALEGSVSYMSSDTVLSSGLTLSRRSTLQLATGYFVSGGTDRESREVLPLINGVRGGVVYGYALARADTLTTDVSASAQRATATSQLPATRTVALSANEGWQRRWSRWTNSQVSAGVGVAQTAAPAEEFIVYPTGSGSLSHRFLTGPDHGTLDLIGTVSVEGVVDQFTAEVDPRLRTAGRVVQTIKPVTMYGEVSRTQSLRDSPNELELTAAEVGLRFDLTRALALEGGARVVNQSFPEAAVAPTLAASGLNWAVFVALDFHFGPRPIRYLTR